VDAAVIDMLRRALGTRDGVDVRWVRSDEQSCRVGGSIEARGPINSAA
jgi:hypothetical protein